MSSTGLQWIDSHAHLDYEYPFSQDEYIERAKIAGVTGIITVGSNRDQWPQVQQLAHRRNEVFYTVGIHPHDAVHFDDGIAAKMREHAKDPRCIAIGEVGLDYHYDHSPRDVQQDACRKQLSLALDVKKPVIIHSRDGEEDLLKLLQEYAANRPQKLGVIHCFSGTLAFARETLKLGFYVSFSGIVTFKKADEVRLAAAEVPMDRILVETDSPYLAPVPYRGKQNESAYMVETCKKIAEIKGIGLADLSRATVENTRRLFGI